MNKFFYAIVFIVFGLKATGQNRFDIVISELMPDPTPVVALPSVEFIEIKNTTSTPINLFGWRVADLTSVSGAMPNYVLKPDSFLIICSSGSVAALSSYGPILSVTSFPSLDNASDVISIRNAVGATIHAVAYTLDWYQNVVKQDGGWSLEMIDTKNPCIGKDNWKASVDVKGGTPGTKNSVDAINADAKAPQLLRTYTNNANQIVAVFNEPMDSTKAALFSNYTFSGGAILSAVPQAPLFQEVVLNLATSMNINTVYNLTVANVTDCKGNAIGGFNKSRTGLPLDADSLSLVVNEILFNPKSGGYDFVELYNNSSKVLDASKLYIANLNSSGVVANVKKLSEIPFLIFPQDYITVSENALYIKYNFTVANPDWLIEIPTMPSFNDDEGNVLVLNFQGKIIDQLNYKDDWHFKLIDNEEGISLERIDFANATQNEMNWHSASFSSGYGTPTAKNSQFKQGSFANSDITIFPKTFSPDNDGIDDLLIINYQMAERGFVANVIIYDANGNVVKNLKRNDLLGLKGTWTWDGLNNKFEKLPTGIYIVYTDVFDLKGNKKVYKNSVVLARRLK
jgi:hypothetical protein